MSQFDFSNKNATPAEGNVKAPTLMMSFSLGGLDTGKTSLPDTATRMARDLP
jgi:hypothetical protein